jgi:DivIVA domain-containing protein
MRCGECAAEVAVTARVCSRCGAPIVGQPPAASDTVVAAISDAAGKALPAVAGKALREPHVPGSGDRIPAELRLVLAGYVGIACGCFAGALACAAAAVFLLFFEPVGDDDLNGLWFGLAVQGCISGFVLGPIALQTRIRFSRLLRRPSDPQTATVMALRRGGRTLILDIIPGDGTGRRYQPLSEVRLALWTKASMLVPGETVNVYRGSGGESELLISSPQRGRAFLGTMKSRSTVQPGPVAPFDEKVSGATLVDWAAWAASTTFSSTGLKSAYDKQEVDAFRSAVRDAFSGVRGVRSDDVRGKQFLTSRPGYDKTQVAAFVEAAGLRLAAMESTDRPDRPAGPVVSGALLVGWAEWADSTTFSIRSWGERCDVAEVDALREAIRDKFIGIGESPVRADGVRGKRFPSTDAGYDKKQVAAFLDAAAVRGKRFPSTDAGYDKKQVAAFLDAAGIRQAAMESTDKPPGPLVSGAILAGWAEWAYSTRFSTHRLEDSYDTAEVDAFQEQLGDTFLGVREPPVMPDSARGERFSTHTRGYDTRQVDAFLDTAAWRLAAMRATDNGAT